MTKTKVLLCALGLLASGVVSCFCDDCTYTEQKYPAYANESGEAVKIVAIEESYAVRNYEKIITDDDTLHYKGGECTAKEWFCLVRCGDVLFGNCDKPAKMKMELHFLGKSKKCLIFEGPIERNGIDMRSWNSYKKGNVIKYWDFGVDMEYVYTITTEHKAMAKESYCPLGI